MDNKVYVVYEIYEKSFRQINDMRDFVEIKKVFKNLEFALSYIKNELSFQCDCDEDWSYKLLSYKDINIGEVYYGDDWQYSIICKEMLAS